MARRRSLRTNRGRRSFKGVAGVRLCRYGEGEESHVLSAETGKPLCMARGSASRVRPSTAAVCTCYRCIKIVAMNDGLAVETKGITRRVAGQVRQPKRGVNNIIPDGKQGLAGYIKPTGYARKRAGLTAPKRRRSKKAA